MQTEKELAQTLVEESPEMGEGSREETLQWLLELDRSEPEDRLFQLDLDDPVDEGLSDYEAEVASRPMFRGKAGADDLSTYVSEEIVISSHDQAGDIYANREPAEVEEQPGNRGAEENMAVDYSARKRWSAAAESAGIDDGLDILGGLDEDSDAARHVVSGEAGQERAEPIVPAEAGPEAVRSADVTAGEAVSADGEPAEVAPEALESAAAEPVVAATAEGQPGEALPAEARPAEARPGEARPGEARPAEALDYVAAYAPESDDEAFDQFLLHGADMSLGEANPDDLMVTADAGVPPVDPSMGPDIDYHPDFHAMPGFEGEPGARDIEGVSAGPGVTFSGEAEVAPVLEASTGSEVGTGEEAVAADIQVFGDDLFEEDISTEAFAGPSDATEDIDAFFDDIQSPDSAGAGPEDDQSLLSREEVAPVPQEEPEDDIHSPELVAASSGGDRESGQSPLPQEEAAAPLQQEEPVIAGPEGDMSWCVPEGIAFNYTSCSGAEIFTDFLDAFIEEGSVELEKLEDAVSAWEEDVASEPAYTTVTRTLHTIKGIAKGVGLQFYGTLIHNFETLLEALPRPEAGEEQQYFRIVNAWLDTAVRGLEHVQENRQDIASEFPGPAREVSQQKAPSAAEPETEAAAGQAVVAPVDIEDVKRAERKQRDRKLADEGARALAGQQSVRITPERLDHLLNLSNQAQQLGVRTAQSTARGKRAAAELQSRLQSIRSHIAGITDRALVSIRSSGRPEVSGMDALEMDQYSELQEAANILREGIEDLADLVEDASRHNVQVEALLKQQSAVITSIGSSIRAARVVPVSRLMPGLRRLVRTVSNDLEKNVNFSVLNEVGTLDRDDYARCQIILEHMVRNALDHGIEAPGDRHETGKPLAGQITVDVRQVGANSLITLADDGRGIDPQAMRENARRKGLDVDVDALSDEEALHLIFHKGFSTADSVSEISGRGVGMDIVLNEIQQMGGDVRIDSTPGEGTAFHINIPTHVTVNGALMVSAGDSCYAIPLGGLIAVEQLPAEDFFDAIERGIPLEVSGMQCQPTYLATLCQREARPDRKTWSVNVPVIVAGFGARRMAIAIDHVEEALELVIRSLGPQFASVPGLAGAATTADGEAVVALDLNLLVDSIPESERLSPVLEPDTGEPLRVLVVDDSRTQRMVTTSQLETLGVETLTAENGGVAIDLLNSAERLPDIVLLDVEMPVKDGIQTLREIRKSVRYSHLPVIMVTSRTGLKHRTLAEQAGCNGYMGKPFNFPLLVGQINELTGHRLQLD